MSIENDITAYIDTCLGSMTILAGYNYDWTAWNVYKPASRDYPQGFSSYTDVTAEEIIMSNKYTSTINALFTVIVDNTIDVDLGFTRALEDIQLMFDTQHAALQAKGMILERHGDTRKIYSLNKYRPGKIEIDWTIRFRVSMTNPNIT